VGTSDRSSALTAVSKVIIPESALSTVIAFMRSAGRIGCEALALWVGEQEGERFEVREAYIPEQRCIRGEAGLLVHVDEEALHQMNVWLFEKRYTIAAQLHSHPTGAYHSETDDLFPIATKRGSFSIVVPDFARDPFHFRHCAVYRLNERGWAELGVEDTAAIFEMK
jgi:hypothetical protein